MRRSCLDADKRLGRSRTRTLRLSLEGGRTPHAGRKVIAEWIDGWVTIFTLEVCEVFHLLVDAQTSEADLVGLRCDGGGGGGGGGVFLGFLSSGLDESRVFDEFLHFSCAFHCVALLGVVLIDRVQHACAQNSVERTLMRFDYYVYIWKC